VVRRALFAVLGKPAGGIARGDVWLGLAALVAYLLVWNMFLAITWWTWAVPLVAGAWGTFAGLRRASRPRLDRRAGGALVAVAAGWAILADQALGPADDYDFGLYHLNLITYAEHYAAVPGLANLHSRLGAGDAHLLLAAFLDRSPVAGAGPHLVVGLLVSLLLLDVGLRLARPGYAEPSFSRRLAVLLVPAVVVIASLAPQQRLSSPNLDLGVAVAAVVGMLYLAECIERGFDPGAGLTGAAMLAVASATRPLYWPLTIFAAAVFVFGARTARAALAVFALPALVAAGWVARQAVLSGYPPLPAVGQGALDELARPDRGHHPRTVVSGPGARWPEIAPTLCSLRGTGSTPTGSPGARVPTWWRPSCSSPPGAVPRGRVDTRPGEEPALGPMLAVVVPRSRSSLVWFLTAPIPALRLRADLARPASALAALGATSARTTLRAVWTGLAAVTAAGAAGIAARQKRHLWMLPGG
jgi:hypothetical protein